MADFFIDSGTPETLAFPEQGAAAASAWEAGADAAPEPFTLGPIDEELRADAVRRLRHAMAAMERFLLREESLRAGGADPTRRLARTLDAQARQLLDGGLAGAGACIRESTLRSAYRLTGMLANLAAWSAPASQESCALNSFPVAAARDVVAYSRFGCPATAVQESVYTDLLGFEPSRARLLLTSSGMAAYSLIENFLLREVLRAGDRVLLHPGVYFETQEQLRSLPFMHVETAAGASRADMLAAIAAHRPRVVFVDPLTNSADLRVLNLSRLLEQADSICLGETWFVIDGTLLSGGFDPFAGAPRRHVRCLYYESGCKYLQFGMDLGPSGVVVVETALAERFERLRRGIGAIAAETLVLPRASRGAYLDYLRLQTTCARLVAQAVAASVPAHLPAVIEAVFPGEDSHPDCVEAAGYPHLGGVLVFRFTNEAFNRRRPLEAFIDMLIAEARSLALPLTAGVSFGFRVPRIGAAWSSYDADGAFLRLSAGVSRAQSPQLGRMLTRCAVRFVAGAACGA